MKSETADIISEDIVAGRVGLKVVAAKKPGEWIVRGMSPFESWDSIRQAVERMVGDSRLRDDVEWSHHEYEGWPHYVVYGGGDLAPCKWPSGVFLFRHADGGTYGGAERLGMI